MESLGTPPADWLALLDLRARAPTPLEAGSPVGAVTASEPPFAFYLESLALPVPGGEALPVPGNALPVVTPAHEPGAEALPVPAPLESSTLAPLAELMWLAARAEPQLRSAPANDVARPRAVLELAAPQRPPGPAVAATPENAMPLLLVGQTPAGTAPAADPAADPAAARPPEGLPIQSTPLKIEPATATGETPPDLAVESLAEIPQHGLRNDPGAERTAKGPRFELPARSGTTQDPRRVSAPTESGAHNTAGVPAASDLTARAVPTPEPVTHVSRLTPRPDGPVVTALLSPVTTDAVTTGPSDWLPAAGTTALPSTAVAAPAAVPGAPVDLKSPGWQEAFANRVQWLVDHSMGEARIRLNPPDLGAVDVKISLVEDKTFVQLTATTAATRDEFTQSLPRLRELFAASGLELGGASVHDGRGAYSGDPHPPSAHDGAARSDLMPAVEHGAPGPQPRTAARIDVFA